MKTLGKILLLALLYLRFTTAFADVKLPAVFSDGMVLQQKTKAAIWGWAAKDETITITPNWTDAKAVSTKADASGKWKAFLTTPTAGGPYTLMIRGTNTITLKDILIGEVWLCSGQSNMGFTLKSAYKAKEEIAAADFPSIRYFSVKRQYGPKEFNDAPGSVWEKTLPQNAGSFSAVAYFFAKKLHEQKGVPVGIIFNAWGGAPAEAWTPSAVLNNDAALTVYTQRWSDMFKTVGRDSTVYHTALAEWEAKRKTADSNKLKKPQEPATLISYNRPWREPSVLFNGMVCPLIPFTLKGFLWYQGESNVNYADEYVRLFSGMIEGWRERWNDKTLPFYFVEIAPFVYADMEAAARLRDAQQTVARRLANTAVVTTVDVGNMKDQHPVHKKEVGDRLASIALRNLYGERNVIVSGPEVQTISREGNKVVLGFDKVLQTTNAKPPAGFEVGYKNEKDSLQYVPAEASMANGKLMVWSNVVALPIAVRYAWVQIGEANVAGTDGWPVAPFSKSVKE